MRLTNLQRDTFTRAVMDDVPVIDNSEKITKIKKADAYAQLPRYAKTLFNNPKTKGYVNHRGVWSEDMGYGEEYPRDSTKPFVLSKTAKAQVQALLDEQEANHKLRSELKSKIRGAAYAASTLKALQNLLPDFVKYMPSEDKPTTKYLPAVVNLGAEFAAAGWPKPEPKK